MIKFDSQNFGYNGNEKEIAKFIAEEIAKLGYEPDIYSPESVEGILNHPDYWHEHNMEDRFNVSAVIKGEGFFETCDDSSASRYRVSR